MTTLREDCEAWYREQFADDPNKIGALSEWLAYQAATERAAKLAAELAYDAAIKYANGRQVDFEQEVGDAIRGTGGGGS